MLRTLILSGVAALALSGAALAAPAPDGHQVFADNCAACHQPEGQGIAGAFPALAANTFVQGPPDTVIAVLLNGRGGMPSFRNDLSDDQIAAVLSFVRSTWGNKAAAIAPPAVTTLRGEVKSDNPGASLQAH